jgi:hypothetical protein
MLSRDQRDRHPLDRKRAPEREPQDSGALAMARERQTESNVPVCGQFSLGGYTVFVV